MIVILIDLSIYLNLFIFNIDYAFNYDDLDNFLE